MVGHSLQLHLYAESAHLRHLALFQCIWRHHSISLDVATSHRTRENADWWKILKRFFLQSGRTESRGVLKAYGNCLKLSQGFWKYLIWFLKKIERFEVDAETKFHADLFYEIAPMSSASSLHLYIALISILCVWLLVNMCGNGFILMQTGWIKASRRITRRFA